MKFKVFTLAIASAACAALVSSQAVWADHPGKLLYGPGSFRVLPFEQDSVLQAFASQHPEKEEAYRALLISLPTAQSTVEFYAKNLSILNGLDAAKTKLVVETTLQDFGLLVKRRLKACIKQTGGMSATAADKVEEVVLPASLAFWGCFLSEDATGGVESQAAALAWVQSFSRTQNADAIERMMTRLLNPLYPPLVAAFKAEWLDSATIKAIGERLDRQGARMWRKKDLVLIGQGPAYFLLVDLLEKFDASNPNEDLQAKLKRVMRTMQGEGIPVVQEDMDGAIAFYSPMFDYVSFSIPHGTDANTFAHEMNHARYRRFEASLTDWAHKKGYAIPYEIDGPNGGWMYWEYWYGGFMNLLNELNSWRIGESFDGGKSDTEIYKILKEGYGPQAGEESLKLFEGVWPLARVEGTSVPKLILGAVKSLNAMTEAELIQKAMDATQTSDVIGMYNVLRLTELRYTDATPPPQALVQTITTWEQLGPTDDIKTFAGGVIELFYPQAVPANIENFQKILGNTSEYFAAYGVEGYFPRSFPSPVQILFYLIEAEGHPLDVASLDLAYDSLKTHIGMEAFPRAYLKQIEPTLEEVLKAKGNTLQERLTQYFTTYSTAPFAQVWDRFVTSFEAYDYQLMMTHHLGAFGPKEFEFLIELFTSGNNKGGRATMATNLLGAAISSRIMSEGDALKRPYPWVSSNIDMALTRAFFDDTIKNSKELIASLVAQLYTPEDLPLFTKSLAALAMNPNASNGELRKINTFFSKFSENQPEVFLEIQSQWANLILDGVLSKPNIDGQPKPGRALLVAEFFRSIEGKILGIMPWGNQTWVRLNPAYREELLKFKAELGKNHDKEALLYKWNGRMWEVLTAASSTLREAAIYGIARHPLHMILLENQILKALNAPSTKRTVRTSLLKLIAVTEEGFLPKIDLWLAKALKDPNAFSSIDKQILSLRHSFLESCNLLLK